MSLKRHIPTFFSYFSKLSPYLSGHIALQLFKTPMSPARSEAEMAFWNTGERLSLSSKRECRSWGGGDKVIFLVHGWESRGATYYKFIQEFIGAGYRAIAWDGPAHGDSKLKQTNIIDYTSAIAQDITELDLNIYAILGHSYGGACLGILNDFMKLPPKVIIIAAPSTIHTALKRFKHLIKLNDRAFKKFVELCEKNIGTTADKLSLTNRNLDNLCDCLVIHDVDDKDIPLEDFNKLKVNWPKAKFIKTKGLGHKRIIKEKSVAQQILHFLS